MASLGVGIVGLPNVGKSTLFNAITKAGALAANYPFATIDKNVGVVTLPDPRLNALQKLFIKGERVPPIVPTHVEFVDIAGLVKGAHKGEGLGNQFLANIREVAAIAHVVRCFEDPNVVHVAGKVDPLDDLETINTELALADLQTIEKRLDKLRKSAKSDKDDKALLETLEPLMAHLSQGQPIRTYTGADPELLARAARELGLLTYKPVIYVCNVAEEDLPEGAQNPHVQSVREVAAREGAEVVVVSAKIEAELAELSEEEAQEYLRALGLEESGLNRLVRTAYHTLACKPSSPLARRRCEPGPSAKAPRPPRPPARFTPTSSAASSGPRLSSGTGWWRPAAGPAPRKRAGCAPRARTTWYRTAMWC